MESEADYCPPYKLTKIGYELATLGPSGTCSHQVGERYLKASGLDQRSIILTGSFEEAAELVKNGKAKRLLVPSAYRKHADIVFDNAAELTAVDAFPSPTPEFFFLTNPKAQLGAISRIASHATPRRLIDRISGLDKGHFSVIEATSNANAAQLLESGEVDGCLTVRSERTESMISSGKAVLIAKLGFIMMTWSVIAKSNMTESIGNLITKPLI